jgi:hypothetical protein
MSQVKAAVRTFFERLIKFELQNEQQLYLNETMVGFW